MSAALPAVFFIVLGLAACFRAKEWGRVAARRVIAYDAVWFYQLLYFIGGIFFVAVGVALLIEPAVRGEG